MRARAGHDAIAVQALPAAVRTGDAAGTWCSSLVLTQAEGSRRLESRDDGAEFPEHDENSGREQANGAQQDESYYDTAGDPKEHRSSPQHRGLRHLDDVEGVALVGVPSPRHDLKSARGAQGDTQGGREHRRRMQMTHPTLPRRGGPGPTPGRYHCRIVAETCGTFL